MQANFNGCVFEYFNKKNSRFPVKLIDDMVTRYPDFVVSSSLNVIIDAATEDAKSNFLLAESYRMLTNILKRFPSLTPENKATIIEAIPSMVGCVVNVVSSDVTSDVKSKRVKPILTFAKDIIHFLKGQQRESAETLQATVQSIQELKATFSSANGPSHMHAASVGPAVQKLFAQACNAAEGLEAPDIKPTGRKKRGDKEGTNSLAVETDAAADSLRKKKSKKQRRQESCDDSFGGNCREIEVDYEKELAKMSRTDPLTPDATKSSASGAAMPEKSQKKSKKQRKKSI